MKKVLISLTAVLLLFAPIAFAASSFKDVDPNAWYYPYVMKASEMGIIDGFKDGTFKPGDVVTRAQLTKVIVAYDDNLKARTQDEDKTINAIANAMPSVVKVMTNVSIGTGFFVRENILLTNRHVVEDNKTVEIKLSTGQSIAGTVLFADAAKDIAIVQVSGKYNSLELANDVIIGQTAIAIGNPKNFEFSAAKGIVSKLDIYTYKAANMFQIDTPINAGNSGGPILNNDGQVIGMVTGKYYDPGKQTEGMAYAIHAKELASYLKQHGK